MMAKTQTLTIVVPDDLPDPADLVRRALRFEYAVYTGDEELAREFDHDVAIGDFVLIIEED